MKRIVALIIGIVMLLSTTVVYAIDIDWDSITLDEMLELQDEVRIQILKRLNSHSFDYILRGTYICGEDIKPGVYLLSNEKETAFFFHVYTDEKFDYTGRLLKDEICRLELKEGMRLEIPGGMGYLTTWIDPSWAP